MSKRKYVILLFVLINYTGSAQGVQLLKDFSKIDALFQAEKYDEANETLKGVIPIAINQYGSNNKRIGDLYFVAGFTNVRLGNIDEAIQYLEKFIFIFKSKSLDGEKNFVTSLFVLGELYSFKGNNKKAEQYVDEGVLSVEKAYSKNETAYYSNINRASSFYNAMNLYDKAEPLAIIIRNFVEQKFGKDIDYVVSSKNLAFLYLKQGKQEEAISILVDLLSIIKKIEGKMDSSKKNLNFKQALAEIYYYTGNYNKAIGYYEELLSYYKNSNNFNHTAYASILNSLGQVYDKVEQFDKSIEYHLLSLQNVALKKGERSNDYLTLLSNISLVYWRNNEEESALNYLMQSMDFLKLAISEKHTFMSESEKENYLNANTDLNDVFASFALENKKKDPLIISKVYDNALFLKGQLLTSAIALRRAISTSGDATLLSKYDYWISVKKEISTLLEIDKDKRSTSISQLEKEANSIEKDLILNSENFRKFNSKKDKKWQDVQQKLKPGEVAIEFIDFKYHNEKWTGEKYYCALILKTGDTCPKMIYLFKEQQLESLLSNNSSNNKQNVEFLYGTNKNKNSQLYDLIWRPLEKHLTGSNTIYFSPSGLLNIISFSSISDENSLLCNSFLLVRLNSTGTIGDRTVDIKNISAATLFGGIKYGNGSNKWSYLEGTNEEVREAKTILSENNIRSKIFTGDKATENTFKNTTTDSDILHIATHGFFKVNKDVINRQAEYKETNFPRGSIGFSFNTTNQENPLLRSGLVFAGANNLKNNIKHGNGILTALEVGQLDMNQTKLVILSACETGLGDIRGNEGVYGLQRSFKKAGANYIIMSLWKVPDNETKEFMILFYKNLFFEQDILRAFQKTQRIMSKDYDPYYWAGFVLVN